MEVAPDPRTASAGLNALKLFKTVSWGRELHNFHTLNKLNDLNDLNSGEGVREVRGHLRRISQLELGPGSK